MLIFKANVTVYGIACLLSVPVLLVPEVTVKVRLGEEYPKRVLIRGNIGRWRDFGLFKRKRKINQSVKAKLSNPLLAWLKIMDHNGPYQTHRGYIDWMHVRKG